MKLLKIYWKIKCLVGQHEWIYNNRKDEILFDDSGKYVGFNRFCIRCHIKQQRQIFDSGRVMIWKENKVYTSEERRIMNLKNLIED